METGLFDVGGAELYYEKRGIGPSLLLIAGAGGDGGSFSEVAEILSDTFTVINYDRRGNSRSSGRVTEPMRVSQQSDDAAALIRGLAGGSALVFGNSGGAIVGLDLAARHGEIVEALVAHEPPIVKVLPDNDEWYFFFERIGSRYSEAGPAAAGAEFIQTVRGEGQYPWPDGLMERFFGNVQHLFETEWEAWGNWQPDFSALSGVSFPIVLAAGSEDRGAYYARPSVEIARRLGAPWAELPGIHLEFLRNPASFAAGVRPLLTLVHTTAQGVPDAWAK